MPNLLFVRPAANIEKAEHKRAVPKVNSVVIVGVFIIALVAAAIVLYGMNQPDGARLVIDLAVAFFAWSTGRAMGEKAGVESE
jgi:hypothetical protein